MATTPSHTAMNNPIPDRTVGRMANTTALAGGLLLLMLGNLAYSNWAHSQEAAPVVVDEPAAGEAAVSEDPPSRAARLSYRQGEISLQPAGTTEWITATLNRPLTAGDRLWTEQDARTELQVGNAVLHVDELTAVGIDTFTDDTLALQLTAGSVVLHVRTLASGETIGIATPNSYITIDDAGEYQVAVNASGDTTIMRVHDGAASVDSAAGNSRTYQVTAGRQGIFTGNDPVTAAIDSVPPRDDFTRWAQQRYERGERAASSRYVSREVVGYEDLDDHGDWEHDDEYGHVWYPRVHISTWAPYRYGQWVWVRPWGWTWIDDAPWGYAPFHYGRWAYVRSRWCWVPGPRHVRPVYAPALVAWIGSPGSGVSLSFGSGVSWFPLGPRDVYIPGYRASRRYVRNVNVANTVVVNQTIINNYYDTRGRGQRYTHLQRRDALTTVPRETFARGGRVGQHLVRNDDRWDENAASGSPPDIAPDRSSLVGDASRPSRLPPERIRGRVLDRHSNEGRTVDREAAIARSDALRNQWQYNRPPVRSNDDAIGNRVSPPRNNSFDRSRGLDRDARPETGPRIERRPGISLDKSERGRERGPLLTPAPTPETRSLDSARDQSSARPTRPNGRVIERSSGDTSGSVRSERSWNTEQRRAPERTMRPDNEPGRDFSRAAPRIERQPAREDSQPRTRPERQDAPSRQDNPQGPGDQRGGRLRGRD